MASPAEGVVLDLEGLFSRYHASTVDWAARRYGNRTFAEDVAQEAYVQILAATAKIGCRTTVPAGAAMVRRHTAWAALKLIGRARAAEAREQQYAVIGMDEDNAWVRHEACDLVASICGSLSVCHREILYLRYLEGYSDAECAKLLGITTKAARSRRRRAIVEARKYCSRRVLF